MAELPKYRKYGANFQDVPADAVLRSAEGDHFLAHKQTLALATPFLATFRYDFFDGDKGYKYDGLPVIPFVTESTRTVECILRFCYPQALEIDLSLAEIRNVLAAAKKYDMQGVQSRMERQLLRHIEDRAVDAYAIAMEFRLVDVARKAARSSLSRGMDSWSKDYLTNITGVEHDCLWTYRQNCLVAAGGNSLPDFIKSIMKAVGTSSLYCCTHCGPTPYTIAPTLGSAWFWGSTHSPTPWWLCFFINLREALQCNPSPSAISDMIYSLPADDNCCENCKRKVADSIYWTLEATKTVVERAIACVSTDRSAWSSCRSPH